MGSPAEISQAEDRLHRIGAKDNVLVQHLVMSGSLDAIMARRLLAKQKTLDVVLG
jgi:SNF2 family DNA or RNA helicase